MRIATLSELQRAVDTAPANPETHAALGHAFIARDQFPDSLPCFQAAVRLADVSEYRFQLGRVLSELGQQEEAAAELERARDLEPGSPRCWGSLGWLYAVRLQRFEEARRTFLRGLALDPSPRMLLGLCRATVAEGGDWPALLALVGAQTQTFCSEHLLREGLANALMRYGRYEDAHACMVAAPPNEQPTVDTLLTWGLVEHAADNIAEAHRHYERAFTLFPTDREAIWRYCEFLFRRGEDDRPREIYRRPEIQRAIHGPVVGQRWTGTPLRGKTVLFKPRGRFGDTVNYCRFGSLFGEQGADVIVETSAPMRDLLSTLPHVRAVHVPHDEPVAYDFYCERTPAMMLLDWDWATIGRQVPYLSGPRDRIELWRARTACDGHLRVGVVWRAGYDHDQHDDGYSRRAIPAAALQPLAEIPGLALYNLFVGRAGLEELERVEPPLPIRPLSVAFTQGLADYAAAIEALDLVVTVDTAAAHVAGAVGTPSLMMLPFRAALRWGDPGFDRPWYPTCQFFRQSTPGEWRDVIANVCAELRTRVERVGIVQECAR